jgi:hypothetical protein
MANQENTFLNLAPAHGIKAVTEGTFVLPTKEKEIHQDEGNGIHTLFSCTSSMPNPLTTSKHPITKARA